MNPLSVDEYLKVRTGEGAQFWMDWIGNTIPKYTNQETKVSRSGEWLASLSVTLWLRVKDLPCYDWSKQDENIICSSLMGLILILWSTRVIRAKSFDPRRPELVRREMVKRMWDYRDMVTEAMLDSTKDKQYFPLQEWKCPFTGEKV